jgi:cytochrome c-type biogenesis protein CcmH/NrfF
MKATFILFLISFCLASLGIGQIAVQEDKSIIVNDTEFRDVAGDLRCPTCTGLSVLDSDAPFSVQIKNEVRSQLSKGASKDDVMRFFTERYGPWILRAPPKSGINWLAWIVPTALIIAGPLLIFFFIFNRKPLVSAEVARPEEEIVQEMMKALSVMRDDSSERPRADGQSGGGH